MRAIKNRREFFESFAVEHGFDPLSPTHWYKQSIDQIMASKVHSSSLSSLVLFLPSYLLLHLSWFLIFAKLTVK